MFKRLLVLSMVFIVALSLLSGCSLSGDGKKVQGEIVYGMVGDPVIFNPILQFDESSGNVCDLVFQGLVEINETLEMVPCLAEKVEYSDDGKIWTFTLRKNITWHDGQPFTAADVEYTYNAIMHDDYTGVRKTDFSSVEKVEAEGDNVIKLYLTQPDASLITKLTIGIIPKHVFESTSIAEMRENPANMQPIGTGPYKYNEWAKGQYIVLKANDKYWREGPWIEQVRFKFFQDNQVMLSALEAGEIDYMESIPVDDIERIKSAHADRLNFSERANNGYTYIGLKQNHPILKDKLVRQGLTYAINREQIVSSIFKGYGTVLNGNILPTSWAFNPDLNPYNYDKEKAVQLLEQAGWTEVGDDGIRVKAGKRLSFKLITSTGSVQREAALNIIQEQWKEIGVEANVEYYEWSVLCSKHLDIGQFEAYLLGWGIGIDPDCYLWFHSSSGIVDGVLQGFNDVEYSNKRMDELLEDGRTTLDQEQRKAIYQEVQQILNDELPYVFLYTNNIVTAMDKKFEGVIMSPLGPIYPEYWYIKK